MKTEKSQYVGAGGVKINRHGRVRRGERSKFGECAVFRKANDTQVGRRSLGIPPQAPVTSASNNSAKPTCR